jgi:hypothetical protein
MVFLCYHRVTPTEFFCRHQKGNHASAAKGIVAEILFALRTFCNLRENCLLRFTTTLEDVEAKRLERIARFR